MNLKKGYVVARKSYGKDVIFVIDKVIKRKGRTDFAILKGLTIRIKADAPVSDLEIVSREEIEKSLKDVEETIKQRARKISEEEQQYIKIAKRYREIIYTGKILHLDGDRKYMEKSVRYYKHLGLNAIVRNVLESRQPHVISRIARKI